MKARLQVLKGKVFYGIGEKENEGDYRMVDDLNDFIMNLEKNKSADLFVKYDTFKNDDHDTVFPAALTQGLLYIYGIQDQKIPQVEKPTNLLNFSKIIEEYELVLENKIKITK